MPQFSGLDAHSGSHSSSQESWSDVCLERKMPNLK